MELVEQFLIGEPDQIVEASWNEPFGVLDLQLKLGTVGGVLKAVEDIAEGSGFAQKAGSLFEIVFADGLPELQDDRGDVLSQTDVPGGLARSVVRSRRRFLLICSASCRSS